MAFFAKFRRKLRTKNIEAHFYRKLRTFEKCSNVKKLRTAEPQLIFTGSYKKKRVYRAISSYYNTTKTHYQQNQLLTPLKTVAAA